MRVAETRPATDGNALAASPAEADAAKRAVRDYWATRTCGVDAARSPRPSWEFFEEIEAHRYREEAEIFSFAQFTRHHGQRVLEIGVGAGTDLLQWARAGALVSGIDLTEEAVDLSRTRLDLYGLRAADLRVADCESLPFADHSFDLVYSWGVLHHTPDLSRALGEAVRVVRPGGQLKLMVYNRHSVTALALWIRYALLRGRPWRSLGWVLANHMESRGTRALTRSEVAALLSALPVTDVRLDCDVTRRRPGPATTLRTRALTCAARIGAAVLGWSDTAWFLKVEARREGPAPR